MPGCWDIGKPIRTDPSHKYTTFPDWACHIYTDLGIKRSSGKNIGSREILGFKGSVLGTMGCLVMKTEPIHARVFSRENQMQRSSYPKMLEELKGQPEMAGHPKTSSCWRPLLPWD